MQLSSPVFKEKEAIPAKYTCDGENISPPLEIVDVPQRAESLALILDDPDAPSGRFVHWTVWNIKPNTAAIEEGETPDGTTEGATDFGASSYGGPCPHSGTHRYFFKLYALDTTLTLPPATDVKALEQSIAPHAIAFTKLIGIYKRTKT